MAVNCTTTPTEGTESTINRLGGIALRSTDSSLPEKITLMHGIQHVNGIAYAIKNIVASKIIYPRGNWKSTLPEYISLWIWQYFLVHQEANGKEFTVKEYLSNHCDLLSLMARAFQKTETEIKLMAYCPDLEANFNMMNNWRYKTNWFCDEFSMYYAQKIGIIFELSKANLQELERNNAGGISLYRQSNGGFLIPQPVPLEYATKIILNPKECPDTLILSQELQYLLKQNNLSHIEVNILDENNCPSFPGIKIPDKTKQE